MSRHLFRPAEAPGWFAPFSQSIERRLRQVERLPAIAVADLPDASGRTGMMIFVPDESGGAVPAYSDGTDWRRVTDRAVVS